MQIRAHLTHRPQLARAVAGVLRTPSLLRRAILDADGLLPTDGLHLVHDDAHDLARSESEHLRAWAAARTTDPSLLHQMLCSDSSTLVVAAAASNRITDLETVSECVRRGEPYSSTCVSNLPIGSRLAQIRSNPELLAYSSVIDASIEEAYTLGPPALRELCEYVGTSYILHRVWDHAMRAVPNLASLVYIAERTTGRHTEDRTSLRTDWTDEWVLLLQHADLGRLRRFAARGIPQNVGAHIHQSRRRGEAWASRLPRSVKAECERLSRPDTANFWPQMKLTRHRVRKLIVLDDRTFSRAIRGFDIEPNSLERYPQLSQRITDASFLEMPALLQLARAHGGVELVVSYLQRAAVQDTQTLRELLRMLRFITARERLQLISMDPDLLAHCAPDGIDAGTYQLFVECDIVDAPTRAAFLDNVYLESSTGSAWAIRYVASAAVSNFPHWRPEAQNAAVRHVFDRAGESVETYEMLQSLLPSWKLTVDQLATSIHRLGRRGRWNQTGTSAVPG